MAEREKLILIDGHSILNRAFYGMPDLTSAKGVHTGAVYGFLNILFRIVEEEQAQYLVVAFDRHEPTFRHEYYAAYKGTRHPMPDELREQVPLIKEVLHAMGITTCEQAGIEADDILGTLAVRAERDGLEVTLVSGDRDLLQIASDHILIRIPKTKRGQTTVENYHAADVREALGVTPKEFIQVKALQGDTADNIPGVPKVGPKTATRLIAQYHSVEGVYEHLGDLKGAVKKNLEENRDKADLSLFLATIRTDCDLPLELSDCRIGNFYTKEAFERFTELGFKNFLPRFSAQETRQEQESFAFTFLSSPGEVQELVSALCGEISAADVAVLPLYDGVDYVHGRAADLAAVCVSGPERTAVFGVDGRIDEDFVCAQLRRLRLAARAGGHLAVFDLKPQFPFWGIDADQEFSAGISLAGMTDLLLCAYLINPLKSDYAPEDVISEYLDESVQTRAQLFGKRSLREVWEVDSDELADWGCRICDGLRRAAGPVREKLEAEGMGELYRKVELPLTYVLWDMERIGISVHPEELTRFSAQLGEEIDTLQQRIYEATGEEFNIGSPKQLGTILFEKMGLPGGKKTKTGYSTAASVLEKLAPEHPVVSDILRYRELTKLRSTYAEGLAAWIGPDGKIHSRLNQSVTATGRLSSADPNLQNIPMRTDLGRQIRRAFVPADGYVFTDADYSQIELRILAHMSGDEGLIEAYHENEDIHRITASKVFHTPIDEVTPQQRRNAKAVNFGIVYGISSYGLGENLSITPAQAKEYIEAYFATYPGVERFLESLVTQARDNGYAKTLYGRRRPVPELGSSNFMQRKFGERVAMNSPIQGTAADIMKIAMIRVWERLHREGLHSELILQIHDELLIETAPGEEEEVRAILAEEMRGAADLRVELETDVHAGADWYLAK